MPQNIPVQDQYEQLVQKLFDELMELVLPVCKNEQDAEKVRQAFYFARDAHKGVKRKSGEPYITHPLAVAKIVVGEIGLGVKSVIAALVHDVVEDTEYTVEDIEHLFGAKIASMVDGLTKLSSATATSETSEQAENFKKMLLTLSDDVRVIIIKIADRLHNMRTLGAMPAPKQMKIAGETIYLFVPLAYRLGLYAIKTELENLSLKYRFPEEYNEIAEKLNRTNAERIIFIDQFIEPIREKLRESDIDAHIYGRVKNVYSIWKKMKSKNLTFEEIYDLCAIRIIFKPTSLVPEKTQCWHIYSLITDIYKSNTERIRDWVNIPKANGYEALHCTVMSRSGIWIEVQIRSERMDAIAERGFAAHWRYKSQEQNSGSFDEVLEPWLRKLREVLNNPQEDAVEFLDNFKMNLAVDEVVVFTPKGESRTMPKGATVLDFAYNIHSKIGSCALGAKVNYKLVPLSTKIHSGDQIEIITSATVKPKVEWLEFVTTGTARNFIKKFLKSESEDAVKQGQELFEQKMKDLGITQMGRVLSKVIPEYKCANKDQFYNKLGLGQISLDGVEKILRQNAASKLVKYWTLQIAKPFKGKKRQKGAERENQEKFVVAECCHPIPGDTIIGFNEDDGTIDIHKKSCLIAVEKAAQHGNKIVDATWSQEKVESYLTIIDLRGIDRKGMVLDLMKIISEEMGVNIRTLNFTSHDGVFEGEISLYVRSDDDMKMVLEKVSKVKGVDKIHRRESTKIN